MVSIYTSLTDGKIEISEEKEKDPIYFVCNNQTITTLNAYTLTPYH